jgi:hypothetical protein
MGTLLSLSVKVSLQEDMILFVLGPKVAKDRVVLRLRRNVSTATTLR